MKRRNAIQNIAVITTGVLFLPACQTETELVYGNIPLESDQRELIRELTAAILPTGELEIDAPESTPQFVLTMINDCFAPKDIQQYLSGLTLFQQNVLDKYGKPFKSLNPEQIILHLTEITNSEIYPKSLKYFLKTTKELSIQHFTTTEYFLKEHMNYEFAPARYLVCVPV